MLTVYRHPKGRPVNKQFRFDGEKWVVQPTASLKSSEWEAYELKVDGIDSLSRVVSGLSQSENSYVVRGRLRRPTNKPEPANRRYREVEGKSTPSLSDAPSSWICIDCDDLPYPEHSSKFGRDVVEYVVSQLPSYFRDTSYHFQFSGSAGIKDTDKIKLHLFFWLNAPITSELLREWYKTLSAGHQRVIDRAVFRATQPIITATPKLIGGSDPLTSNQRQGLIKRKNQAVTLPSSAYEVTKKVLANRRKTGRSRPTQPYSAPVPVARPAGISEDLNARLLKEYNHLKNLAKDRYNAAYRLSCKWGGRVKRGEITREWAVNCLLDAASCNNSSSEYGEHKLRAEVENGLDWGIAHTTIPKPPPPPPPDYTPSTPAEIQIESCRVIDSAVNEASSETIQIVKIETGAGKTYQSLKKAVEVATTGRLVVFASATDDALSQAKATLKSFNTQVTVMERRGELKHCKFYMDQPKPLRERLAVIRGEGRVTRLCHVINNGDKCPYIHDCELRHRGLPELEGIVLTTHSKLARLKVELPEDALIFIDETPSLTGVNRVKLSELEALICSEVPTPSSSSHLAPERDLLGRETTFKRPKIDWSKSELRSPHDQWRFDHKDTVGHFAKLVLDRLKGLHIRDSEPTYINAKALKGKELKDSAQAILGNIEKLRVPQDKSEAEKAEIIIAFADCENDGQIKLITNSTIRTLKQLVNVVLMEESDATSTKVNLTLSKSSTGELVVEQRYLLQFPHRPLIVLDATPPVETWKCWSHKCHASGGTPLREIVVKTADIRPPKRRGIFIQAQLFQSRQFWSSHGRVRPDAIERQNRVMDIINKQLGNHRTDAPILLASSKRIRTLIDETQAGNTTELTGSPIHQWWSQFQIKTGHSGADHRGSNDYKDVSAVVVLGAQRKHLIAHKADLEYLTLELAKTSSESKILMKEDLDATHAQWFGRARALRRPHDEIVYVLIGGDHYPNLRGVTWEPHQVKRGPEPSGKANQTREIARSRIDQWGSDPFSVKDIAGDNLDQRAVRKFIQSLEDSSELKRATPQRTNGRPAIMWQKKLNDFAMDALNTQFSQEAHEPQFDSLPSESEWPSPPRREKLNDFAMDALNTQFSQREMDEDSEELSTPKNTLEVTMKKAHLLKTIELSHPAVEVTPEPKRKPKRKTWAEMTAEEKEQEKQERIEEFVKLSTSSGQEYFDFACGVSA